MLDIQISLIYIWYLQLFTIVQRLSIKLYFVLMQGENKFYQQLLPHKKIRKILKVRHFEDDLVIRRVSSDFFCSQYLSILQMTTDATKIIEAGAQVFSKKEYIHATVTRIQDFTVWYVINVQRNVQENVKYARYGHQLSQT